MRFASNLHVTPEHTQVSSRLRLLCVCNCCIQSACNFFSLRGLDTHHMLPAIDFLVTPLGSALFFFACTMTTLPPLPVFFEPRPWFSGGTIDNSRLLPSLCALKLKDPCCFLVLDRPFSIIWKACRCTVGFCRFRKIGQTAKF